MVMRQILTVRTRIEWYAADGLLGILLPRFNFFFLCLSVDVI